MKEFCGAYIGISVTWELAHVKDLLVNVAIGINDGLAPSIMRWDWRVLSMRTPAFTAPLRTRLPSACSWTAVPPEAGSWSSAPKPRRPPSGRQVRCDARRVPGFVEPAGWLRASSGRPDVRPAPPPLRSIGCSPGRAREEHSGPSRSSRRRCSRPIWSCPTSRRAASSLTGSWWDGSRCSGPSAMPCRSSAGSDRRGGHGGRTRQERRIPGADMAPISRPPWRAVEVPNKSSPPDAKPADVLLSHAADSRADFLVMGGFGHSRLREFVLGGVTCNILEDDDDSRP